MTVKETGTVERLVAEMQAGLEGVTPGPWQRSGVRQTINENCIMVGPDGFSIVAIPHGRHPKEHAGAFRDAAHIARCSPDNIAAILSELTRLKARADAADDLLDALRDILTALREEAPGTRLNNHRFDGLGLKAYAAVAKAERARSITEGAGQ